MKEDAPDIADRHPQPTRPWSPSEVTEALARARAIIDRYVTTDECLSESLIRDRRAEAERE